MEFRRVLFRSGLAYSHRVASSFIGISFGASPYTLFVLNWTNTASGQCCRVASSKWIVPSAFTSKSKIGMSRALSCEGCAAQCTIKSNLFVLNSSSIPLRSRISSSACRKRFVAVLSRSRFHSVSPAAPKNTRRMLLSTPTTSCPCASKWVTASDPISPLLPVTKTFTCKLLDQENAINTKITRTHVTSALIGPRGQSCYPGKSPPVPIDRSSQVAKLVLRSGTSSSPPLEAFPFVKCDNTVRFAGFSTRIVRRPRNMFSRRVDGLSRLLHAGQLGSPPHYPRVALRHGSRRYGESKLKSRTQLLPLACHSFDCDRYLCFLLRSGPRGPHFRVRRPPSFCLDRHRRIRHGSWHLVHALRRHARANVARSRSLRSPHRARFASRRRMRLRRGASLHQSFRSSTGTCPRRKSLYGCWHLRHALHRYGRDASSRRLRLRPSYRRYLGPRRNRRFRRRAYSHFSSPQHRSRIQLAQSRRRRRDGLRHRLHALHRHGRGLLFSCAPRRRYIPLRRSNFTGHIRYRHRHRHRAWRCHDHIRT